MARCLLLPHSPAVLIQSVHLRKLKPSLLHLVQHRLMQLRWWRPSLRMPWTPSLHRAALPLRWASTMLPLQPRTQLLVAESVEEPVAEAVVAVVVGAGAVAPLLRLQQLLRQA